MNSTDLDWGEELKGGKFEPWLLQVIKKRGYVVTPRHTLAEAREAWEKKLDLLDSGLPRKIAQFCDDLVAFHYMGNAEYEFGSIPHAIAALFATELVTREIRIPKEKLPSNSWARSAPKRSKKDGKKSLPEKQDMTLYYLGPKKYVEHLDHFIDMLCKEKLRTKAGDFFSYMADPVSEYDKEYQGWLCLDYPFWMTKDREVWAKLVELYTGKSP